jgi:kynurenine formamidase
MRRPTTACHAALAVAAIVSGCASAPALDQKRLVDLTHPFSEGLIVWPSTPKFEYTRSIFGRDDQGRWYATGDLRLGEMSGTHLAAPLHLSEGARSTSDIPLEQLVGPIRVVTISTSNDKSRDYVGTPRDLVKHEQIHGRIPAGAAVVIRTGWEKRWTNPRGYLGKSDDEHNEQLHFPGIGLELARELIARHVDLVAIDGPGIDPGISTDYAAERALAEAGIPVLLNLTEVAGLPDIGATMIALPMKLDGGAGGPVRVVALVP